MQPTEQWNVYESFIALLNAGTYHLALEGILILWIFWLLTRSPRPKHFVKLSKKEEEELLLKWDPEPLIDENENYNPDDLHPRVLDGDMGLHVKINGRKLVNLASHNYLNFSDRKDIQSSAIDCLNVYGVGSCGPRGFYGTSEVHLDLEDRIAKFFGCEMGVLYSYGFSTIASAIPAYSKKGDIIYADECVNFAIQRGIDASRSDVFYFKHNDPDDLERILMEQEKKDKKNPKKAAATRKFLIVEGIYVSTGDLCKLPELVDLRRKYKLRLFIDESTSFGTLGASSRGAVDHFNIPKEDIDMIMCSLETSAASSGGFTVGTKFVVEHQRLAGLGYCFSASLPPMLAAASIKAIDILEQEGGQLTAEVQKKCRMLHEILTEVVSLTDDFELLGDEISPIKHLRFRNRSERNEEEEMLRHIVNMAEKEGVAIVLARHLETRSHKPPPPSIRIAVNKDLTLQNLERIRNCFMIISTQFPFWRREKFGEE